jgi:hypothetical protein
MCIFPLQNELRFFDYEFIYEAAKCDQIIRYLIDIGVDFNIGFIINNKYPATFVELMLTLNNTTLLNEINFDWTIHNAFGTSMLELAICRDIVRDEVYSYKHFHPDIIFKAIDLRDAKLTSYLLSFIDFETTLYELNEEAIKFVLECGLLNRLNYYVDTDFTPLLVEYGYNLNMEDENGNTFLFDIVDDYLVRNCDVNHKNKENETPLLKAIERKDYEGISLLVKAGAVVEESYIELADKRAKLLLKNISKECPFRCGTSSKFLHIFLNKGTDTCLLCMEEHSDLVSYECGHVPYCQTCFTEM